MKELLALLSELSDICSAEKAKSIIGSERKYVSSNVINGLGPDEDLQGDEEKGRGEMESSELCQVKRVMAKKGCIDMARHTAHEACVLYVR